MFGYPKIQKNLHFLAKPWVLATLITIATFPFFPDYGKYRVKLIETEGKIQHMDCWYDDLNNDGISEKIIINTNPIFINHTLIHENNKIIDQWNYPGEHPHMYHHFFGDYNHDGCKEMYVFSCLNDSLFLWITDVFSGKKITEKRFITHHYLHDGKLDVFIQDIRLIPGDSPGKSDLFFDVFASYSYRPRKLFIYTIEADILISTPESGSGFDEPYLFDIDKDQHPEFFGWIPAHGNSPDDYIYSDSICWLMAYDDDLSFLFDPIPVGFYSSYVDIRPALFNNQIFLVALYHHKSNRDSSSLSLYSLQGKLIKQIHLEIHEERVNLLTDPQKGIHKILLHYALAGKIEEYDFDLNLIHTRNIIPISDNTNFQEIDLEKDGISEWLGESYDQLGFIICRNDYSHPVAIKFPGYKSYDPLSLFSIKRSPGKNELFFSLSDSSLLYEYKINPLFYLQYAGYIGIFLLLLLIMTIIEKVQRKQAEQRFQNERKMSALQLNALEKQLNPHFTLNILNSVGALYENKDIEKAQYYFGKYSKLLRKSILLSGEIAIPIQEELEFVRNYLELEKLRMNFLFDYEIQGEENLPEMEVPKMLIHSFVENAVKHGIKHLKEKGHITIRFKTTKNQLEIFVSDDGIGREKAKQYSLMSTGRGLQIVNDALNLYFELKKVKIVYEISDLYKDNGQPGGTEVKITVPLLK